MSLAAGSRLGPYEVLGLIGAGGMGEVYKARDTRLDRTVAIKVLPAELAADPDRRARFAREAKAVSQLAHPHICVLHDVGQATIPTAESPASSPVTVDYLVMEYLEGETLAGHLARVAARTPHSGPPSPSASGRSGIPAPGRALRGAPLPLDETLRIGTELAEALAAAHKAGIIHRDLKPGNVMLTPAGVKVLDFGLARLLVAEAASGASSLATRTVEPLTDAGTRLGTVPYMAPEQVEGKEADARSDVFALGATLYEMATGHRAFEGETAASVAAAILDREPEPVTAVQPLTPPAFEHVVTTCLAKDPEARWQAASDVARELRWIADEARVRHTPAGGLTSTASAAAIAAARMRRVKRTLALATVGLALVGSAAGVTWIVTRTSQMPGRPVHFWIDPRPAEYFRHGSAGGVPNPLARGRPNRPVMAVAPNGETLAFVAASENQPPQIYLRHEGGVAAQPLPGTENAVSPIFSPDGRWIAYWSKGNWMKVPIDGRSHPVLICPSGPPFGASWAPDGTTLIFAEEFGPLLSVSASDATPRALTQVPPSGDESHRLPHLLPNGRGVLFTVLDYSPFSIADWEAVRVEVLFFATRERKLLLRGAVDARYLPTGHLLYARRGSLEAVPFDLDRLEVTGAAFGVVPDVMQSMNTGNTTTETGAAQVALSPAGTLAYLAGGIVPLPDLTDFMWIDRTGRVEPVPIPPGPYYGASLSPDGKRLAFRGAGTRPGLWVWDFERAVLQNVTSEASHRWPLWTRPDGKQLVHGSYEKDRWTLVMKDLEGGAPPQPLAAGYAPACWSRDGRYLVYTTLAKPTSSLAQVEQSDIWVLRRDGAAVTTAPWVQTAADEDSPDLSPDGRWLAYTVETTTGGGITTHVYVEAFPGHSSPKQVSDLFGWQPLWSRDGTELFFLTRCKQQPGSLCLAVCTVRAGSTIEFGRQRELLAPPGIAGTAPLRSFDSVDGQRFLYLHVRALETPVPPAPREMHVVLNWFEELKAKVPATGQAK